MKELLLQFSGYHLWANGLLLAVINELPPEKQQAIVKSSFNSLYKTVLHIWEAESIWWQRLKQQEQVIRPGDNFSGGMKEVGEELMQQSAQWNEWVANCNELALQQAFVYKNSKKEQFEQPFYQVLLHLFNHGTYHRGQLVTLLRQLEVEKIPATDFIVWSRRK
jgi:uncharacterized damage-inducible protein DinB